MMCPGESKITLVAFIYFSSVNFQMLRQIACCRVILVNMEISVILGHEKTKICNIIYYGKIDIFSVRTNIHIKNKMMGHLI